MAQDTRQTNKGEWHERRETLYDRAVTGFKNYWYPLCGSREVGKRPVRLWICGEPLAVVRSQGKVYAMVDECPHRGARMSLGKMEFPGVPAIACRFHGWTFDLEANGACVAALTDGPDSPVVGKIRLRMFPTQERKGIVWVWMGRGAPVPLEEDAPRLLLREDTLVHYRWKVVKGNWRYHAEGGLGNHAMMLHRDAVGRLFHKQFGISGVRQVHNQLKLDPDDGVYLMSNQQSGAARSGVVEFEGLGSWPPQRPWRFLGRGFHKTVAGKIRQSGTRLPGLLRIPNFPMHGGLYYEWYIAMDAGHYRYFQVSAHWPKNPLSWLFTKIWYHLWARPMQKGRFNDQDKSIVLHGTEFEARHGANKPTLLFRPDVDPYDFIEMCNRMARGEAPEEERQAALAEAQAAG
ncbi:MAG: Rieske 2Fe-2S domain-containing protein [Chloroflexota bacterium]|nr:Rieske 2Fe-2S domain-containing protein [Chloroflexota bacterium]